jgi:hypothetical protein
MINFIATGEDGTARVRLHGLRMEGTTLTRPEPGTNPARGEPAPGAGGERLAKAGFALLCAVFAVGFFVFPTYPVYDSYYSLLWGKDLLGGRELVFDGFRYPTEHPLAIAVGAVLQLFGQYGDRLWVGLILASFLVLVVGVYRLGRIAATPLVGTIAAVLLLTRFDYPFLAARGYIDIPYMALVVWAGTLEATRPRRGVPVLVLLAFAGMLRPEAWFLAAMYWVWVAWRATWRERILFAALAAAGPVTWAAVDFLVTGNPLFSQQYTSGSAEDLGRQRPLSELPAAVPGFFEDLVKLPVLIAAGLGALAGVFMAPRRMLMPLVLLGAGLATFFAIGVAGASVIERYLAVPALALMVLAAVAVGGWTMLLPGRVRTAWMAAAVLIVVGGIVYTALNLSLTRFDNELRFRDQAHEDLEAVLDDPRVRAGLRCGPLTGPNHKIVPDSRWIAGLDDGSVLARAWIERIEKQAADAAAGRKDGEGDVIEAPAASDLRLARSADRGVAIVVTSRFAIYKHAWSDRNDDALIQVPPPGFERVKTTRFYAAYVRC